MSPCNLGFSLWNYFCFLISCLLIWKFELSISTCFNLAHNILVGIYSIFKNRSLQYIPQWSFGFSLESIVVSLFTFSFSNLGLLYFFHLFWLELANLVYLWKTRSLIGHVYCSSSFIIISCYLLEFQSTVHNWRKDMATGGMAIVFLWPWDVSLVYLSILFLSLSVSIYRYEFSSWICLTYLPKLHRSCANIFF